MVKITKNKKLTSVGTEALQELVTVFVPSKEAMEQVEGGRKVTILQLGQS